MPMKLLERPEIEHDALCELLASALNERDRGLLTQMEYEDRVAQVALSRSRHTVIEETEIRGRGTRFIVRDSRTGGVIGTFEYPDS
jgi:hypothetical protein